eukprot:4117037-Pleurochrysis_carterae.AAC.1
MARQAAPLAWSEGSGQRGVRRARRGDAQDLGEDVGMRFVEGNGGDYGVSYAMNVGESRGRRPGEVRGRGRVDGRGRGGVPDARQSDVGRDALSRGGGLAPPRRLGVGCAWRRHG